MAGLVRKGSMTSRLTLNITAALPTHQLVAARRRIESFKVPLTKIMWEEAGRFSTIPLPRPDRHLFLASFVL
jgi:hypothetical protein